MEHINDNLLQSLYYHITNRCNLKCKHCWVRSGEESQDQELTMDEAISIVKQCQPLGLKTVKLTGGEPLVVSWVMDFIEFLCKENLTATVETNAALITDSIARRLSGFGNIRQVAISIDGSTASSHEYLRGVPGCFDKTIQGIKSLIKYGIIPDVMTAVHKGNLNELSDIGRLVSDLGMSRVKLNCVHGDGRGEDMEANNETLDVNSKLELFDSLEDLEQETGVKFQIAIPLSLRPMKKLKSHFCGGCNVVNTLGLLPNGDFALCGIGLTTPELRFGNHKDISVSEIWNGNSMISDIANGLPDQLEGACGECVFKTQCRGGCRALAYVNGGSLMSPDSMCQWAKENNMIQKSRIISS